MACLSVLSASVNSSFRFRSGRCIARAILDVSAALAEPLLLGLDWTVAQSSGSYSSCFQGCCLIRGHSEYNFAVFYAA
ncbi:hypothetical protein BDW71DRAFT_176450, partial [Aspergillus fruticulosus]